MNAKLLVYVSERLREVDSIRIFGTAEEKRAIVSFAMDGVHPQDIATIIDRSGRAIRAGTHSAIPLLNRFGVSAARRASFGLYNTMKVVDLFVQSIWKAHQMLV